MKQTASGSDNFFLTKLKDQKSQNIQTKLNKYSIFYQYILLIKFLYGFINI